MRAILRRARARKAAWTVVVVTASARSRSRAYLAAAWRARLGGEANGRGNGRVGERGAAYDGA